MTASSATRQSSGAALDELFAAIPEMIGGSADLTGSNNTNTAVTADIAPGAYGGRYVRYGVREHAMGGAVNGMAAHGGIVRPYGSTFLQFADYMRPAVRLAALMEIDPIYVWTHDSIGLGEDGPTHQPVEHLAALRAIPNLQVFRPADVIETAEAWEIALQSQDTPSVLALTRQNLPVLRTRFQRQNLSSKGARCPRGHVKVSWNVRGPRGAAGAAARGGKGAQTPGPNPRTGLMSVDQTIVPEGKLAVEA